MATFIVDPDNAAGTDYTSLASWESSRQRSLTEPEIVECRCTGGTADPGQLTIDGWVTSDSNYIEIKVADGYRHNGTVPTSGNIFRCEQNTDGVMFRSAESYYRVDGIVYIFSVAVSRDFFEVSGQPAGWVEFKNCIAYNTGQGNRAFDINHGANTDTYYTINCQSIGMTAYGMAFGGSSSLGKNYVYNCLVVGWGTQGFRTYTVVTILKNCISNDGANDCYSSSVSSSSDTNISDTTDGCPGANSIISTSVLFENAGSSDYRLSKNDTAAKEQGLDLSADSIFPFDYDCAGRKRLANKWDIGPYQVTKPSGYHLMV